MKYLDQPILCVRGSRTPFKSGKKELSFEFTLDAIGAGIVEQGWGFRDGVLEFGHFTTVYLRLGNFFLPFICILTLLGFLGSLWPVHMNPGQ